MYKFCAKISKVFFAETYFLTGSLITEVDKPIRTIKKHSEAEVGNTPQRLIH